MNQLQGLQSDLPILLSEGEIYRCTDTASIFIGTDKGNLQIPSDITIKISDLGVELQTVVYPSSISVTAENDGTGVYRINIPALDGMTVIPFMTADNSIVASSDPSSHGQITVTTIDTSGSPVDVFDLCVLLKVFP